MPKPAWITPLAALALAACVADVDTRTTVAAPEAPTPQQIVAARQAAFHMSGAAMGQMKGAIDRGADPKTQAYAAAGVARWAKALPSMFPEITRDIGPHRVRPEVWANKPDFNAKAAAYVVAADQLVAAARSGDKDAFAAAHQATGATCKACHDPYQVPQPPGG
jgi:cytochrome c556